MTNQQQQQQQQQQQHRFPKKLIDYLHVVKKLTRPGFSNVISTDAENVLEQIIKQRQQQVGDQDSSFMSKSTGCSRSGTISSTCGHNKHDSGLNDYDYCFRVKISPYACFPKDDIDSTTASTRSSKSTRSSTNTNINTSTTVEVMDTLDMDTKSSSTKVFPLSGILALIDDFTTYAIVSKDRYSRAGVSVHLSTSLTPYGIKNLRKLMPNDELDINVKIVKIGSRFGFTEACVICCNSGNIIANGKHTKFLEVGTRIQKFVLSSFMLPLLSWWCTASTLTLTSILASILTSKETSRLQQEQKEHTDHHSSSSSIQKRNLVGIQDLFKFELVNDVYKYENEITKVKGKVKGRGKGKINLNQYHMNPMGTCHVSASSKCKYNRKQSASLKCSKCSLLSILVLYMHTRILVCNMRFFFSFTICQLFIIIILYIIYRTHKIYYILIIIHSFNYNRVVQLQWQWNVLQLFLFQKNPKKQQHQQYHHHHYQTSLDYNLFH
jgi:hypothetical protein